jgi:hypothetical protein
MSTLVLIATLWVVMRPHARAPRRVLLTIATTFTLASLWPVATLLGWPLTRSTQPLAASAVSGGRTAIVLLGTGHLVLRDWSGVPTPVSDAIAVSRVLEAARVYRLSTDGWIISSGGSTSRGASPSSEVMRDMLVSYGVPASRILLESTSGSTRDEAVEVARMLPDLHADRVVVVTSPSHIPRSLGAFRAVGIPAIPAIAREWRWTDQRKYWIKPDGRALVFTAGLAHEYLGLIGYAARGWYR